MSILLATHPGHHWHALLLPCIAEILTSPPSTHDIEITKEFRYWYRTFISS